MGETFNVTAENGTSTSPNIQVYAKRPQKGSSNAIKIQNKRNQPSGLSPQRQTPSLWDYMNLKHHY